MSASDHLQGLQFHVEHGAVEVHHPEHGVIGRMYWDPGTGEIQGIGTQTPYQRRGVATAMWHAAQAQGHDVRHSKWRSDSGDAWARSVTPDVEPRHSGSSILPG